jgi:putative oxidoreductase
MSKGKRIALWVVTGLLAVSFLAAGGSKFANQTMVAGEFERYGYPGWFSLVVGTIEIVSALLLLVPRTAAIGAFALMVTMVGAAFTHLRAGEYPQALAPVVLFALAAAVFYARRRQLVPTQQKMSPQSGMRV